MKLDLSRKQDHSQLRVLHIVPPVARRLNFPSGFKGFAQNPPFVQASSKTISIRAGGDHRGPQAHLEKRCEAGLPLPECGGLLKGDRMRRRQSQPLILPLLWPRPNQFSPPPYRLTKRLAELPISQCRFKLGSKSSGEFTGRTALPGGSWRLPGDPNPLRSSRTFDLKSSTPSNPTARISYASLDHLDPLQIYFPGCQPQRPVLATTPSPGPRLLVFTSSCRSRPQPS